MTETVLFPYVPPCPSKAATITSFNFGTFGKDYLLWGNSRGYVGAYSFNVDGEVTDEFSSSHRAVGCGAQPLQPLFCIPTAEQQHSSDSSSPLEVSCLTWFLADPGMFAIGIGQPSAAPTPPSVSFSVWSTGSSQAVYRCPALVGAGPVTAISWLSTLSPALIGIGNEHGAGGVRVYDLRRSPLRGPVWQHYAPFEHESGPILTIRPTDDVDGLCPPGYWDQSVDDCCTEGELHASHLPATLRSAGQYFVAASETTAALFDLRSNRVVSTPLRFSAAGQRQHGQRLGSGLFERTPLQQPSVGELAFRRSHNLRCRMKLFDVVGPYFCAVGGGLFDDPSAVYFTAMCTSSLTPICMDAMLQTPMTSSLRPGPTSNSSTYTSSGRLRRAAREDQQRPVVDGVAAATSTGRAMCGKRPRKAGRAEQPQADSRDHLSASPQLLSVQECRACRTSSGVLNLCGPLTNAEAQLPAAPLRPLSVGIWPFGLESLERLAAYFAVPAASEWGSLAGRLLAIAPSGAVKACSLPPTPHFGTITASAARRTCPAPRTVRFKELREPYQALKEGQQGLYGRGRPARLPACPGHAPDHIPRLRDITEHSVCMVTGDSLGNIVLWYAVQLSGVVGYPSEASVWEDLLS